MWFYIPSRELGHQISGFFFFFCHWNTAQTLFLFCFSLSALFGCSYCHNSQAFHARSLFQLITPVLQMEVHRSTSTQGLDCLNTAWGSKVKISCSAEAGHRRPLKFRAANVFLCQRFQVVKGLPVVLTNTPQPLEDQMSQHLTHSSLRLITLHKVRAPFVGSGLQTPPSMLARPGFALSKIKRFSALLLQVCSWGSSFIYGRLKHVSFSNNGSWTHFLGTVAQHHRGCWSGDVCFIPPCWCCAGLLK